MLTLDENGNTIRVPDEEEHLTEQEKKEKMYAINTSVPLVVERGSYVQGAKININYPFATMDTPISIDIECIRGYKFNKIDIYVNDNSDGGRYLKEDEYNIEEGAIRTTTISFIMPMANVDINIFLVKDTE